MERVAGDGSPGRLVGFTDAVLEEKAPSAPAASAALLHGHRGPGRGRRGGALPAESEDTSGTRHSGATPHAEVGCDFAPICPRVSRYGKTHARSDVLETLIEKKKKKKNSKRFGRTFLFMQDTFYRRAYKRMQELLPVQFQQIYYNDVSTSANFYAYDM